MRKLQLGLMLAAVIVLPLAGCTSGTDETQRPTLIESTPPVISESTPPALDDEEALAELVATTYVDYWDAVVATINAGGDPNGDLAKLATENWQFDVSDVIEMAESGEFSATGGIKTFNEKLLADTLEGDTRYVTAAFCHDTEDLVYTWKDTSEPVRPTDAPTQGTIKVTIALDGDIALIHEVKPYESEWLCN